LSCSRREIEQEIGRDGSTAFAVTVGESGMNCTLVKTDAVAFNHQDIVVRYFELCTPRGSRRYSAEIVLGPGDRIILDGDSVSNLEAKATRLMPATLYSRTLARATAA
jgi:hypothetical protein